MSCCHRQLPRHLDVPFAHVAAAGATWQAERSTGLLAVEAVAAVAPLMQAKHPAHTPAAGIGPRPLVWQRGLLPRLPQTTTVCPGFACVHNVAVRSCARHVVCCGPLAHLMNNLQRDCKPRSSCTAVACLVSSTAHSRVPSLADPACTAFILQHAHCSSVAWALFDGKHSSSETVKRGCCTQVLHYVGLIGKQHWHYETTAAA